MSHHVPEPDPRSRMEDEGIPDLQKGTPGQQQAVDPQEETLPGERSLTLDEFGTTADEQAQGEPAALRLQREEPEEQAFFGADEPVPREDDDEVLSPPLTDEGGLGVGADLDTRHEPSEGLPEENPAQPGEPSGEFWDEPRPAGRLVAPDEGAHPVRDPDETATEVGPDAGGFTAEEDAMHVEPE
ncbi:DUF5709 domain-containing protein [Actinomadura gamaensis]|uniref:DUF5709 domain-containing protein n=1 Tax=Actinomadura gamaensis TaxID=1763541 RepID=A0ABV9TZM8_9ACTN